MEKKTYSQNDLLTLANITGSFTGLKAQAENAASSITKVLGATWDGILTGDEKHKLYEAVEILSRLQGKLRTNDALAFFNNHVTLREVE